ncbi:hypothetical protein SLE2022_054760 [Rubroshorea leprosula]
MAEKRSKAVSDAFTTKIFCEICVEEVIAGNRPNSTFNRLGWTNVEKKFNERTNKHYLYKQLRNRWDALKSDWVLWNQLLKRETGLGWNHEKGTIDATPQRWAELKAENKEYGKFEHHGLENTVELQQMFDKIIVTGETAWTPAAGPIPPVQQNVGFEDAVDLEEGSGDSDEVNVIPTQTGGSSEKGKKNTIGPSLTGKGKKVKVGGAAYMHKQLNRLCDAVESYTTTTWSDSSKKNYETYPDTTEECMEMLLTLPGVEDGNELFMLGTRSFVKREYRNMFRSIKSVNSKLAWLQQELERDKIRSEMERERFGDKRYY